MNINTSIAMQFTALAWVVGLLVFVAPASAYLASQYPVSTSFAVGTVVSLDEKGELIAASAGSTSYAGVVTGKAGDEAVEVATSGTVSVFVSEADGDIGVGTQLGLSSISGVVTASSPEGAPIGTVIESPRDWRTQPVQGSSSEDLSIGTAVVRLLNVTATGATENNNFISAIQRYANGVAGREVDTWRAITALTIGLSGVVLSIILLISSSRFSFLSLGRNPMAGNTIMRGLWKVAAVAVGIMFVTLLVAYSIVRSG